METNNIEYAQRIAKEQNGNHHFKEFLASHKRSSIIMLILGAIIVLLTIALFAIAGNYQKRASFLERRNLRLQEKYFRLAEKSAVIISPIEVDLKQIIQFNLKARNMQSEIDWLIPRAICGIESGCQQRNADGTVHTSEIDEHNCLAVGLMGIYIPARQFKQTNMLYNGFDISEIEGNITVGVGILVEKYRSCGGDVKTKITRALVKYNLSTYYPVSVYNIVKILERRLK
jgi:hypothetical protein